MRHTEIILFCASNVSTLCFEPAGQIGWFRVVNVTIMVCTTCTVCPNDLDRLLIQLRAAYGNTIQIEPSACLAACDAAPAVFLNDTYYPRIDLSNLSALIDAELNAL